MVKQRLPYLWGLLLLSQLVLAPAAAASSLRAQAVVEKSSVFVGESVAFQIRVFGSEKPQQPDLTGIPGCRFEFQGGQQNSSSSITIINGKMTKNVQTGYVFSWQLTPLSPGRLVIPQITVQAEGEKTRTLPVIMTIQKPVETDDFKLRVALSKPNGYVGEPITLKLTWYMSKDVRTLSIQYPFLGQRDFYFTDPKIDTRDGNKYYKISLGSEEAIGKMGKGTLGGRDYTTLTLEKIVIPRKAGEYRIDSATAVADVLAGYRQQKSPFGDDFFSQFFKDDFLLQGRSGVYRKVVTPSNSLTLKVSEVPLKGRPAGFAGHVGKYHILAAASPVKANVGDPITLKVILSGPRYLAQVELPPLQDQPALAAGFKIPKERAVGEVTDEGKVFTQTIRAKSVDVKEIPAIELPYFDTETGTYRIARSEPIPVAIQAAKIITAQDAEGLMTPLKSSGSRVESWGAGIAYNYEGMDVLQPQHIGLREWIGLPAWVLLVVLFPVGYGLLFSVVWVRDRRRSDPGRLRSRRAFADLSRALNRVKSGDTASAGSDGAVLEIFRNYMQDKLGLPGGALTFQEIQKAVEAKGVDPEITGRMKIFFEQCEAGHYAGMGSSPERTGRLAAEARALAEKLEKSI